MGFPTPPMRLVSGSASLLASCWHFVDKRPVVGRPKNDQMRAEGDSNWWTASSFCTPALPHPRNKTISHPLHILGVPWQIFAEKIFLIQDTPNEYREERHHEENALPRTERERHCQEQEQCTRIHWVPDVRVRARRHDGLPLLYPNGRRGVAVRSHHHEKQREQQYDHCACHD